ncbi:gamma-glutamyl-gamma-aminobutyrate hydrolase family protein [Rhodohalobacter sp. 614A]|uniref:gamma-glutamyl-gamma-aminobutyrate hydrolase family protein n=1 Tax=Rhodohalobacter sp. 614A TaxID=2908649 RepID=UPI001F2E4A17|nr:gamma-glutamyl-gamma-aminobutyrate hydrolase family protein [Rhodohalobacter sp. 614A]
MFGKERAVIGVCGPDDGGRFAWMCTAFCVWIAGGKAKRIRPKEPASIGQIDGLILGGGADIEPDKYGQEREVKGTLKKSERTIFEWILTILFFPVYWVARYFQHTKKHPVDPARDKLEFDLLKKALDLEKPVLGICRGMQLINVHFGGSLHQDISGFYAEQPQVSTIFPKKRITIKAGSKLEKLLQTETCDVNGLHNQAIDKLGEGLQKTAKELYSGVWQAIEHTGYSFVIGVQWHPEYLMQISRQRNIFKELVVEAGRIV